VQPEITDMWLPMEGVAHNIAIINIEKSYAGQPQKVAASLWGAGQMMFNKFSLITSLPANKSIRNLTDLKSVINSIDIERDTTIMQGTLDILDHTSPEIGKGGKLSIDATAEQTPFTEEPKYEVPKDLPSNIDTSLAKDGWQTLICHTKTITSFKEYAEQTIDRHSMNGVKFIIILNENMAPFTISEKIWLLCSNCDAKRDTHIYKGVLILDGRIKAGGVNGFNRRFPNIVTLGENCISSRYESLNSGDSAQYKYEDETTVIH
ncbi:MAG: UbiD family decarboxylase, partial [Rikenellaceae bacterium]